ncbi:hypothetical protein [Vibrio cholerae]|uniref:hypothetical protein n=1 Tax=Vibrio cholerae TaxID=666 RepID=UPI0015CF441B
MSWVNHLRNELMCPTSGVHFCVGKCTQYKMDVKAAQQAGKDVSTIAVPEGCEAITEK